MSHYMYEFLGLMAVFSIMIVSPGADFAIVVRQSIVHGRRSAIMTSLGIGSSLLFHISYTVLGLGLLVSKSLLLFGLLKWAGAAYLVYLGIKALRAPAMEAPADVVENVPQKKISDGRSFLMGFVTNALNPKAVLFFLSLFSALVSHETPVLIQASYGVFMALALIAWFVAVSTFFTIQSVRDRFVSWGKWFNRVTGMVFIGLGIKLATSQAS
ncbi:RhtB (resistance to homoserine/threonine) family protein [Phyllobacterium ifriqiyense]|uniref:RhtB (Resistance to homoserine/threonine) family protein n=1 Tax=Phyllobacterium ifriqiyense TaxID=314238 RepID=A0ABU0S9G1_9HYPH|nr:LysE family transporter [Phyllobacterium ifriqiyense]MDQ0997400.1 RhtB (resistance to homoserine/threonine) family protein [Phyllobacterium ifriqiyense]